MNSETRWYRVRQYSLNMGSIIATYFTLSSKLIFSLNSKNIIISNNNFFGYNNLNSQNYLHLLFFVELKEKNEIKGNNRGK